MKQLARLALIPVAIAGLVGAATSIRSGFAATSSDGSRAAPTVADPATGRMTGLTTIALADAMYVDVHARLLPTVVTVDGRVSRSVCLQARFMKKNTFLGETLFHELVPVESTEAIDMSTSGLDFALDVPDADPRVHHEVDVAFDGFVKPKDGKTWGDVRVFGDDLVVSVRAAKAR